jgi:uncharacterized protein (DUF736 family)
MIIGKFITTDNGFSGTIQTLSVDQQVTIERVKDKRQDNHPDYRVFVGDCEIGAGWNKAKKDNTGTYISISIDDPAFPDKLYCALSKTGVEEGHTLYWDRDEGKKRNAK